MSKNRFSLLIVVLCSPLLLSNSAYTSPTLREQVIERLKATEIARAKAFLLSEPITVADSHCERSSGGIHDFYSEGDYWWPNPADLNGVYIQKDGQTNPNNFTAHRFAMIRLSEIVSTLTSAFFNTQEQVYADKALEHLNAWFIDDERMMNSNML